MVAKVQLERRVTSASIFGIIISELRHQKKPGLVILFKVNKGSKICLYCAVLSFHLPVCLRVKCSGESFFDFKEEAE